MTREIITDVLLALAVLTVAAAALGVTRRVLLTGARSLTPNAFVVDLDQERDVMLVHELVTRR